MALFSGQLVTEAFALHGQFQYFNNQDQCHPTLALQFSCELEGKAPVETGLSAMLAPLPGQSGVDDHAPSALSVLPWQWTQSAKLISSVSRACRSRKGPRHSAASAQGSPPDLDRCRDLLSAIDRRRRMIGQGLMRAGFVVKREVVSQPLARFTRVGIVV